MDKVAFVFSGQGDQYPGMGREIFEKYTSAEKIYGMCDSIRPGTSKQCFEGTADELKETVNTQPCLFATEFAMATVLLEKGIVPHAVAGFSLGEAVAATVAGIFDPETGFSLVCKRGELMQRDADRYDTSMVAVVKLTAERVREICERFSRVYPVNFNCPGQVSVSGLAEQMGEFSAAVKAAGGRAIPLNVKGAFHSPFMKRASEDFLIELKKSEMREPEIPLYSDMTAKPYAGDAAELLSGQISAPVKWEELIRNMIGDGVNTFVEIGPGKTLTGMISRISSDVKVKNVTEYLVEGS